MSVAYRCEHQFWMESLNSSALERTVDEPFAALSGVFLMAMAAFGNAGLATDPPMRISMARAALLFCGLGTVAYHVLSESVAASSYTNGNLYDGVSMAVFTYNLLLLHLNEFLNRNKFLSSCLCFLYLFIWVATNDWYLYQYADEHYRDGDGNSLLAATVQYPVFGAVYVYILGRIMWIHRRGYDVLRSVYCDHYPMWIALLVAGLGWVLYMFCCKATRWVFWGHTVWHVGIGYVAIYLVFIGAEMTYKLKQAQNFSIWWPKYENQRHDRQTPTQCDSKLLVLPPPFDTRKLF